MEVRFANSDLARLARDSRYTARLPVEVVRSYRRTIQYLRGAPDERDLRSRKAFHFEKLQGRIGQHSLRLNAQFRLIVEIHESGDTKAIVVVAVEDYH